MYPASFGTADPIIVEDTAELDAALESGRVAFENAARAERYQSDPANDSEASDPEAAESESSSNFSALAQQANARQRGGSHSPRSAASGSGGRVAGGKMSEALANMDFSPKRPRSGLDHRQLPVPPQRSQKLPSKTSASSAPPARISAPASRPTHATTKSLEVARLPDMTGLTSAVETPAKTTRQYRQPRQVQPINPEATKIVQDTVEQLAKKLRDVETEQVTSQRRVRELEMDLERCKADVVRERTRVQNEIQRHLSQSVNGNQQAASRDRKGKGRALDSERLVDIDEDVGETTVRPIMPADVKMWEARYREVVDTKKGQLRFSNLFLA